MSGVIERFARGRLATLGRARGIERLMLGVGLAIVLLVIGMAIFADVLSPYDPIEIADRPILPPSRDHPLGTDSLGRDVFSRVLHGSKTMLTVVSLSTLISLSVGVPLGLLSGYRGGVFDRALSLVMDSIYAFPGLILAIAVAAMLGPGVYNTAISIAVVYMPTYFRMVRGEVLSLKERTFVEAARALGARDRTILRRYLLPNVLPTILVVFSLNVADAVLTEAGLSFLGLSVPSPTPDWGFDMRNGQRYFLSGYWWLVTFPGLMIILLCVGFSLLGEGLDAILNPREA